MMLNIAAGVEPNPYREKMLGDVCYEAFGNVNPSREPVYASQGSFATRILSKGTQRRAELQPLIEQHGPAILSQSQLERARAASKHELCGASQAASAVAGTGRGSTPRSFHHR